MAIRSEALAQKSVAADLRRLERLPRWLEAAVDPEMLRAALVRRVPELVSGGSLVTECQAVQMRLAHNCWRVIYRLRVEDEDTSRHVGLVGTLHPPHVSLPNAVTGGAPLGSPGWSCALPELGLRLFTQPPDRELPLLPQVTDRDRAGALLESVIEKCTPTRSQVKFTTCLPKITRYHPGRRCTILYEIAQAPDTAPPMWPDKLVAKTYCTNRAYKGETAYRAMQALGNCEVLTRCEVGLADPLAYLPEPPLLLQTALPEEATLKDVIRSALRSNSAVAMAQLDRYMKKTAAGLAALHQCGVSYGKVVTLRDEVAELRRVIDRLRLPLPELAGTGTSLLASLDEVARRYPADPLGPAHQSFRPAQVLIHRGQIGFIDFDGFCQAEPALDVARFRASVKDAGMGRDSPGNAPGHSAREYTTTLGRLDSICDKFSADYAARAPVSTERVMLWEAIDLLTNVLHAWTKVRPHRLQARLSLLHHHLRALAA